jgi:hypothetical protein
MAPQRLLVVGTTGAGKSTLARAAAGRIGGPVVELDSFQWGPGWKRVPRAQFRAAIVEALAGERWVAAGNYPRSRDLTWTRADALVWLDYPLPLVMSRLLGRTWSQLRAGAESWGGNRVTLARTFSKDSLFFFALHTHRRWRLLYPQLLAEPAAAHLHVVRLRSPAEADAWLAGLPGS